MRMSMILQQYMFTALRLSQVVYRQPSNNFTVRKKFGRDRNQESPIEK